MFPAWSWWKKFSFGYEGLNRESKSKQMLSLHWAWLSPHYQVKANPCHVSSIRTFYPNILNNSWTNLLCAMYKWTTSGGGHEGDHMTTKMVDFRPQHRCKNGSHASLLEMILPPLSMEFTSEQGSHRVWLPKTSPFWQIHGPCLQQMKQLDIDVSSPARAITLLLV